MRAFLQKQVAIREEWVAGAEDSWRAGAGRARGEEPGDHPFAAGNADWKGTNEWYVTVVLNHYAGAHDLYETLKGKLPWNSEVFVKVAMEPDDGRRSHPHRAGHCAFCSVAAENRRLPRGGGLKR